MHTNFSIAIHEFQTWEQRKRNGYFFDSIMQWYERREEKKTNVCWNFNLEGPIWLMDFLFVDSLSLSLYHFIICLLNYGSIYQSCEVYQNKWDISVTDRFHIYNGQTIQRWVCVWETKKNVYVRMLSLYNLIEFYVFRFCDRTHRSKTVFLFRVDNILL